MAKAGQPTSYRPEYCEQVVELGKLGKSKMQMCASFNISRQTIDNWAEKNPEFLEALNKSVAHAQNWWENTGQEAMMKPGFNAVVWTKSMQARFRDDYTEKQEIAHSGDVSFVTVYESKPEDT